jgi:hypothetical protein
MRESKRHGAIIKDNLVRSQSDAVFFPPVSKIKKDELAFAASALLV